MSDWVDSVLKVCTKCKTKFNIFATFSYESFSNKIKYLICPSCGSTRHIIDEIQTIEYNIEQIKGLKDDNVKTKLIKLHKLLTKSGDYNVATVILKFLVNKHIKLSYDYSKRNKGEFQAERYLNDFGYKEHDSVLSFDHYYIKLK